MEGSLKQGDCIFINKLGFGARMPITLLSSPFSDNYVEWLQLPYIRIPGFSGIKHNDVLLFNYPSENDCPIDKKTKYIKRCVGLPGETIEIENNIIIINSKEINNPKELQFTYRVIPNDEKLSSDFVVKYDISEGRIITDGIYDFELTTKTAEEIANDSKIKSVKILRKLTVENKYLIFPQNRKFRWNIYNIGPIKIPKKGMSIQLDSENIYLYQRIIEKYEGNTLQILDDNSILINGQKATQYNFKQNYYFVLDDNRDTGKDSRYWGFLPEDHIIGKASFIWFSINKNKSGNTRWNRILKSIE